MRFTVGKKIGLGFGIVLILLLTVFGITYYVVHTAESTLSDSIENNQKLLEIEQPTVNGLYNLKAHLTVSQSLILKWVRVPSRPDELWKKKLEKLIDSSIPRDTMRINELMDQWEEGSNDEQSFNLIKKNIAVIINSFNQYIRKSLVDFESYSDEMNKIDAEYEYDFTISPTIEETLNSLEQLIADKNEIAQNKSKDSMKSFDDTNTNFSNLALILFIAGLLLATGTIIIAFFTTLSITKPVQELKKILINLGRGVFPKSKISPSNDEIGEMSSAMNSLVSGLQKTTSFAHEVGQSNFDFPYEPLSDEDVLGHALLKMKDELAETERILEKKVKERTEEVVRQKDEIDQQKSKLEELYNDVTDSIRYAKRLQDSILPPENIMKKWFPLSFVLFKPKDIVSGDFYWMHKIGNKHLFAAVDCTGHGVPGAFMSLVGANGLNGAIKEHKLNDPGMILDDLNAYSHESLNKEGDENAVRDGMDIALCAIDYKNMQLDYAGAYNPLYIIRNGEILITKGDKFAIGSFEPGAKHFNTQSISLEKGDVIYVFSDGYADQFGGLKGKKFMYRQFRETLFSIKDLPMDEQRALLDQKIEAWKGSFEQVDDILIIGVRIE
jgi:serine phosphatase RsbU (regulator of sigma subunit)/CHASE3 domain sensor protein